ncbi:GGDEF domain-containing protein [Azotosporobacter soli]|uniref:GGDEF domain-containing protein n=1 Tax=Azotosporobacter soli TaxID=3055040 RepID=UPI0031FE8DDA
MDTHTELEEIITKQQIRTVLQPIVSLESGVVMGYEALSRGPAGSRLERPDLLFGEAEQCGKLWELELLCRGKALEQAKELPASCLMFINVDPNSIKDSRFEKGLTSELLKQQQISASCIVFEITERTAVEDYRHFRRVLENYRSQGYQIAIDDAGAGCSGLMMLAETRPQFIKIDMGLVRDVDKDSLRQALLRSICDFAQVANMKVIAEGIETFEELKALISIGVSYGQGYLLKRPQIGFSDIEEKMRNNICEMYRRKQQESFHTAMTIPIGEIARRDEAIEPQMTGRELAAAFEAMPMLLGAVVAEGGRPTGLLMKNKFLGYLATQYGLAVYGNRPVSLMMDRHSLVVEYDTPLEKVSTFATSRAEESLYDYIIITKDGYYWGITTVKRLLEKTTQLEIARAKHANPLTGLPGNLLIEQKLKQMLIGTQPFAALYFDLDNFKAYNDTYGFERGDQLLCMVSRIIELQVKEGTCGRGFVGHIGGDDFIAVTDRTEAERVCQRIIVDFDIQVQQFFNVDDRANGYITATNRHGMVERFPLVSLSIAVVDGGKQWPANLVDLAERAGRIKKKCKLDWRSCYQVG